MSNLISSGIKDFEKNSKNPFIEETISHIKVGKKKVFMASQAPEYLLNSEGETCAHSIFVSELKVDRAEFTKIFISNLSSWFELSKTGVRVFTYIAKNLKPNQDTFLFDIDDCKEKTGYKSKRSVVDGLTELLKNKFIARTNKHYLYYINPTVFFNGNRLTYIKSIVLNSSGETGADRLLL